MKFQPGNKIAKGRPKGSVNKSTASVKGALSEAFDDLGGVPALVKWGKGNPNLFYPIWSKMLPTETTVTDMREVATLSDDELAAKRKALLKLS